MRMLDLFSGLAGFALAASWVWGDDHTIISFCEIDKRCRDFLSRAWPGVPCHDDIKTLDATQWCGTVDLLTGGPPCQPVSLAGKRKGKEDDRWLWPETLRIVDECKPTWCCFENPPALRTMGLDGILTALESQGYEVGALDIPATAVDAPHIRHRLWILAHATDAQGQLADPRCEHGQRGTGWEESMPGVQREWNEKEHPVVRSSSLGMADTEVNGIGTGLCDSEPAGIWRNQSSYGYWNSYVWLPCADGKVRRAPDNTFGLVDGLHRSVLGALGNSIVPQVAAQIMRAIKEASS